MNYKGVVSRLRRGEIGYALSRFSSMRAAYSGMRRVLASPPKVSSNDVPDNMTLFPDTDINNIVQSIRDEAVFVGLNLPATVVREIYSFACSQPLRANYDPDGPKFLYADVRRGVGRDGRLLPIGGVCDPLLCPAVRRVAEDPILNAIVQRYLGYTPRQVMTLLNWSFASDLADEERQRLQFQSKYHYDADGFRLVYANFYLTDTDRDSGAHVMMKHSHAKKPLRMLLGSAATSESEVWKQFGRQNEIVIEGPAGTGFVQDTHCYHRASSPTRRDRLMLAVRFIN